MFYLCKRKATDGCCSVVFGSGMLGSVSVLLWKGNLACGTILGTPAEVRYFGSNVTNLEKCVKELVKFVELIIICWKEEKGTRGKVADLRVIN